MISGRARNDDELDTCRAFKRVEGGDVLCSETRHQHTTDAILLWCELAPQKRFAFLRRQDGRVICVLKWRIGSA